MKCDEEDASVPETSLLPEIEETSKIISVYRKPTYIIKKLD
jgi:hypothetical protein